VGSGDTTSNGGGLALVAHTLTGEVSGTTLRKLQDDGGLGIAGSLEGGNNGRGGSDVLVQVSEHPWELVSERGRHTMAGTAKFFS
jgi:hypothetical protein